MALPLRANVPLAALVTFVTNPFTIWFWIPIANRVGNFMIQIDAETANEAARQLESNQVQWAAEAGEMAGLTILGFVVLAVSSAIVGYFIAVGAWRVLVARRRAKRLAQMEERLDQGLNPN